jgi:hypothetical protein
MTFAAAFTVTLYTLALLAGVAWLVRRRAKAATPVRSRPAPLAVIRRRPEPESPIIGWIVRDDPARPDSAARFRS